jgi:cell division protein FtsI/penicillin-binding protein 2
MSAAMERYGFTAEAGDDLVPFDIPWVSGVFPDAATFEQRTPAVAISAIGQQDVAANPLQMALVASAIGNGGVMPPAHVVAKIGGKKVRHGKGHRVVSQHTADRMTAMFRDVVVEGTGTEAAIPGYTVAGKTGTANKAENGRYVQKYVASFVGLVPARKPRLAILVMVDEPHGQIWGGVVAAPIFRDLARFALQYLEVPPDAPESKRSSSLVAAALSTP